MAVGNSRDDRENLNFCCNKFEILGKGVSAFGFCTSSFHFLSIFIPFAVFVQFFEESSPFQRNTLWDSQWKGKEETEEMGNNKRSKKDSSGKSYTELHLLASFYCNGEWRFCFVFNLDFFFYHAPLQPHIVKYVPAVFWSWSTYVIICVYGHSGYHRTV